MTAKSLYGSLKATMSPLCQRHARNAYKRAGAAKKRKSKREVEDRRLREESGQMDMFDLEGGE